MTVFAGSPLSVLTSYQCITSHSIEKADSATWGTLIVLPLASLLLAHGTKMGEKEYILRWPLGQTREFPLIYIVWSVDGSIIRCLQERFRDDRDAELLRVLDVRVGI
jgi:hypothetical protein